MRPMDLMQWIRTDLTSVRAKLTDAVVALDLDTGKPRWSRQFGQDIFVPGCDRPGNTNFSCPDSNGPDADFGSAPILAHAGGREPWSER